MTVLRLVSPRAEASARYRYPISVCGGNTGTKKKIIIIIPFRPPQIRLKKGDERGYHARVVERLDGVLDALRPKRERAIWQSRRARDALELRYALRFLAR
jgi:hypothetical protein